MLCKDYQKKIGTAIFISDKIDFRERNIMGKRTFHKLNDQQEDNNLKFLCTYKHNFQIYKVKLIGIKSILIISQ